MAVVNADAIVNRMPQAIASMSNLPDDLLDGAWRMSRTASSPPYEDDAMVGDVINLTVVLMRF